MRVFEASQTHERGRGAGRRTGWEFDFQVMLVPRIAPVHRSARISGHVYAYKTDDCQKYVRSRVVEMIWKLALGSLL